VRGKGSGASFDDDTERSDSRLAEGGVARAAERLELVEEGREGLAGRKRDGDRFEDGECAATGCHLRLAGGVALGAERKERRDDAGRETEGLNLALLAVRG